MTLALLGDIHGNATALAAVLADVQAAGVHELYVTGDFVGYYYRVAAVFELLAPWAWEGVQGNHDATFVSFNRGEGDRLSYRMRYGHALDLALQTLPSQDRQLLATLPVTKELQRDGRRMLLCHGAPWRQDSYVYPNASPETFVRIARLGYDVVVLGHTHYPFSRREGRTLIINPGSVGQPRDVGGLASWAMLDLATLTVTIHRVRFDPSSTIADARTHDPGVPYLVEVLSRARSSYAT